MIYKWFKTRKYLSLHFYKLDFSDWVSRLIRIDGSRFSGAFFLDCIRVFSYCIARRALCIYSCVAFFSTSASLRWQVRKYSERCTSFIYVVCLLSAFRALSMSAASLPRWTSQLAFCLASVIFVSRFTPRVSARSTMSLSFHSFSFFNFSDTTSWCLNLSRAYSSISIFYIRNSSSVFTLLISRFSFHSSSRSAERIWRSSC